MFSFLKSFDDFRKLHIYDCALLLNLFKNDSQEVDVDDLFLEDRFINLFKNGLRDSDDHLHRYIKRESIPFKDSKIA